MDRRGFMRGGAAALVGLWAVADGGAARALEVDAASSLVREAAQEMIALITSSRPDADKERAFTALVQRYLAIDTVSRVAIGRPWREMSEAQRSAYQEAFVGYISRKYFRRFGGYRDETIEVVSARPFKKGDVLVQSRLTGSGAAQPIAVDWRITDRQGPVQILDIIVEGVSLAADQRTDFNALYERSGRNADKFIETLRAE